MYPWIDPDHPDTYKPFVGINGNGRLNYLLYLEMTGNQDGSISKVNTDLHERFLSPKLGNWTEGRSPGKDPPTQFGTFLLTHRKFINEFLVPKFDKMNRMVKIDLSNLKAGVRTEGLTAYFSRDVDIAIGEGVKPGYDKGDDAYRFKTWDDFMNMVNAKRDPLQRMGGFLTALATMKFPTVLPSNALRWYWCFTDDIMSEHNEERFLSIGYKAEHWGKAFSE
jgi:hypothetical protein